MAKLEPKQHRFVIEYLKDQNATKAAIRAGYTKRNAAKVASKLMGKPHVKAAVEAKLANIAERVGVTAEDVIRQLWNVANVDIKDVFNSSGGLKSIDQMPENARKAISGIDEDELFEGVGRDREQVGVTKKVRFHPKVMALELLAKHFKLLTDKVEHTAGDDWWEALDRFETIVEKAQKK